MVIGNRAIVTHRTPCVVVTGSRIDWIWTAQILGFEPAVVYFRQNNPLVRLVRRLLPNAVIIVGAYTALKSCALPAVAFVHGNVGSFQFLFQSVDVIVTTHGKRGAVPTGWRLARARATHASVGGVTDGVDHCFLYSRGWDRAATLEVSVPRAMPRDVHSIVSDVVCGQPWPKPGAVRLQTPKVLELAPGLYHGGGLLPVDHPHGSFVVRSVYTKSKWCRRRLTKKEVATAFDVPHEVIEACSTVELAALPQLPTRTLEHCAKSVLAHEGIIDRRGAYIFEVPETHKESAPEPKDMVERHVSEHAGLDHAGFIDWEELGEQDGLRVREDCCGRRAIRMLC